MAYDDLLLLTAEEAARRLSLGRTQVFQLIAAGRLDSVKIGRLRRIPVSALQRFVDEQQVAAMAKAPS